MVIDIPTNKDDALTLDEIEAMACAALRIDADNRPAKLGLRMSRLLQQIRTHCGSSDVIYGQISHMIDTTFPTLARSASEGVQPKERTL